ncbi:MAG: sensor histidine kinase [Ruminococcus sp.]
MNTVFWLVEFIACFVESLMYFVFEGTLLNKNSIFENRYKIISFALLNSIIMIVINSVEIFSYVNTIIMIFILYLLNLLIYKKRPIYSFLLSFGYLLIISGVDFFTVFATSTLSNVSQSQIMNEQNWIRVFCILISKAILSLITVTINRWVKDSRILPKKYIIIMFLFSLFLFISNCTLVEINAENDIYNFNYFTMVFFVASITIVFLLFFLVFKITKDYEQQQTLTLINQKNEMLQKSLDDTEKTFNLWRTSIHDYKNNMIMLSKLADENKISEIKEYLEKETATLNNKVFYAKTGNSVADAIINTKYNIALTKNIDFIVNAVIPSDCLVSNIDFAAIIGNLLDNAIEASEKEEKPCVIVNIKMSKNFLVIDIANRYSGVLISDSTTKINKIEHGIGLKSVKNAVKKYDGVFDLKQEGEYVHATVLLVAG